MGPEMTDSEDRKQASGFGDPFRWVWDLAWGVLLSVTGLVLFGNRPRGCKPVAIDTPEGNYHGCGRAWRYGRPRRFAPVCRHCVIWTGRGSELILCSMGQDPRFSLHAAVSVPAIVILTVSVMALGIFGLFSCGVLGEGRRTLRPPVVLERLILGDKPEPLRPSAPMAAEAADAGTSSVVSTPDEPRTAIGTKLAPEANPLPIPSAMERFQRIQEGPTGVPGSTLRPVPRPLVPEALAPKEEAEGKGTDAPARPPAAE